MSLRGGLCLGLALYFAGSAPLQAQSPERFGATSPREIAAALEIDGHPGFAFHVLRQTFGNAGAAVRDSVADVLVAFVLRSGGDTSKFDAVSRAMSILVQSGMEGPPSEPYAGAIAAMMRIVRVDTSFAWSSVISALPGMSPRSEALAGLLEIARYDRPIAQFAVARLARAIEPEFHSGLSTLCSGAPLPNERAEAVLQFYSWLSYQRSGRCAPHAGRPDTSLALAVASWQSERQNLIARLTLRQQFGNTTAAARDSIAESLTETILRDSRDPAKLQEVSTLVDLLQRSATSFGADRPYSGSVRFLTRIAREAGESASEQATAALGTVATQEEAADSLAVLALLGTRTAVTALRTLSAPSKPAFRARVAALCAGSVLPNAEAEAHLLKYASLNGIGVGRCRH